MFKTIYFIIFGSVALASSMLNAADVKIISQSDAVIVVESQASYLLGDGDTRIDARNIVLNKAKRAVAEAVGSQVKSELVINNDKILTDKVTIVAASFMSVEIKNENFTINDNGRPEIHIHIIARVDKSNVLNAMNQYINNVDKSKELEALYEETRRLQAELDRLNKKLSGATGSDKPLVDIVRRDTIIDGISRNSEKIVRTFSRGSLLELAQKDAIENEAAKNVMENKIFEVIKAGTTVTLADPVFKQNANGTYDASISVKWAADPLLVLSDLERYFKVDQNQFNKLVIDSEPRSMRKHYSNTLFADLVKKKIVIRVHFAGQERDITIAAGRNCFVTCNGLGESQYQWMYKSEGKTLIQGEAVAFVSLSKVAIKNSANIKASILVVERGQ